eukprot:TRINITY_DN8222_c0_g1_i3.p1 TRINITY_DN8222_c0_g1~~TRINITY_DN8222_c0_g1_i3.p1  ORF type:complete len:474 (-),score=108.97 TRINITY_DN8222_c0_g1_i3:43-1464(-)
MIDMEDLRFTKIEVLPERNPVCILNLPKDSMLKEAVRVCMEIQKNLSECNMEPELNDHLESRNSSLSLLAKLLEERRQGFLETNASNRALQEALKEKIQYYRELSESKKVEQESLEKELAGLQDAQKKMQGDIDRIIKTEMRELTLGITETMIQEIHYRLSNEPKDPKSIGVVSSIVALLKNAKRVDHVAVNSYFTHYEGFLQKMVGFSGMKVNKETAEMHHKTADDFCKQEDGSLPGAKPTDPKYQTMLPLARWTKKASELVQMQNTIKEKNIHLNEILTRKPILVAELLEIEEKIALYSELIKDSEQLYETLSIQAEKSQPAKESTPSANSRWVSILSQNSEAQSQLIAQTKEKILEIYHRNDSPLPEPQPVQESEESIQEIVIEATKKPETPEQQELPIIQAEGEEKEANICGFLCMPKNQSFTSVSYTHLTLPTILLVQISVVAVSLKKKKKKKEDQKKKRKKKKRKKK